MLGAAPALHAGVGLQADELGQVLAGDEAEIFIADQRWNLAEAAPREKNGDRAEHRCRCLVCGNERQKDEQRQRVNPPETRQCSCPATKNEAR